MGEYSAGKSAIHKRVIRDEFNPMQSQATLDSTFATRFFQLAIPRNEAEEVDFSQDVDDF